MGLKFTTRKSDGVRVHYGNRSDGVRVDHEKKSRGVRIYYERKSDGVKVHHQKERWGESSPKEPGMDSEFTVRKRAMG